MSEATLDATLAGVIDQRGSRWVVVERGNDRVVLPVGQFMSAPQEAFERLLDHGFLYLSPRAQSAFRLEVQKIKTWVRADLIDRVGWYGRHFALGDGSIVAAASGPTPEVVFEPDPSKWAVSGTLKAWQSDIARHLIGQPLPKFAVMLAFAPPLLDLIDDAENYGYELVGTTSRGKSTVQRIAASVWGSGAKYGPGLWWETWSATLNALEDVMLAHRDSFLVLDEAALEGGGMSRAGRQDAKIDSTFKLASGKGKRRLGRPKPTSSRFLYLSSSNAALFDVGKGSPRRVAEAAGVRLLTIPVDEDKFGAFMKIPKGYQSASHFVDELGARPGTTYGIPIRAFLTPLVAKRSADESKLKAKIGAYITRFLVEAAVDQNDGPAVRVARGFAIPYAAGRLAKEYGILPDEWNCLAAAITCFRRCVGFQHTTQASPLNRVRGYVDRHKSEIRDLSRGPLTKLTDERLDACPGFLKSESRGTMLLVPPDVFKTAFPDWKAVLQKLKEQGRLVTDGDNQKTLQAKRTVRRGKVDRMICVRIRPD